MKKTTKGVIYIATGEKYINEVLVSAASLKKHMPNLSITLFSDLDVKSSYFDKIIKIKDPVYDFEDMVRWMYRSPYDYTLYLDSDTYICDDFSELFDLLDRFDIAAAHVPLGKGPHIKGVSESFESFNGGVILFKKSSRMEWFFSEWLRLYLKDKKKGHSNLANTTLIKADKELYRKRMNPKGVFNEPSLKEALYKSSLRLVTLTKVYDFRGRCGYVNGAVKIIHTRRGNFDSIEKIINHFIGPRLYMWKGSGQRRNRLCVDVYDNEKIILQLLFKISAKLKKRSRMYDKLIKIIKNA